MYTALNMSLTLLLKYVLALIILLIHKYSIVEGVNFLNPDRAGLYRSKTTALSTLALMETGDQGRRIVTPDLRGELSLAKALGSGMEQDLMNAEQLSFSLIPEGVATAHTTLGLLLNYNLTKIKMEDSAGDAAISHYMVAALKGDPLAQIIVGEYYNKRNDCESALSHYRRGALDALQTSSEAAISKPGFVKYIWPEDDPIQIETPSIDELELYKHLARNGDQEAALKVAFIYHSDVPGIENSSQLTEEYLAMAVEQKNSIAMVWTAGMILSGEMEGRDDEALDLLTEALHLGDESSYAGLARLYMDGRANLPKNLTKAEEYLKKGIEIGHIGAFYHLGNLYEQLNKSHEEIEKAYAPSAVVGHVHSAWKLAEHFRNRHQTSVSRSISNPGDSDMYCRVALPFYRIVALSGEWRFLFNGAFEDFSTGKTSAALLKYLLLSDMGYPAAHVNAARILEASASSDIYDREESSCQVALEMWRRASSEGISTGYLRIGDYYYYGKGVEMNYKLAGANYASAAKLGNAEASFNLAYMSEWGVGMPQDLTKARVQYEKLIENTPEAVVPATIALLKLKYLIFIKSILGFDLYKIDYNFIENGFEFYYANWDIVLMPILLMIILLCVYLRR